MTRRGGSTMVGRLFGLLGVGLLAATLVPSASSAAPAPERAELTGTGAWSVNNQMNAWRTKLYYSEQAMDLSYLAKGDRDGRQVFARGEADFVISGLPLNAEDNAKLAERNITVISAPISVASMAFLMSGPYPSGLRTFTPDPVDPELEGTFAPYSGSLRLPNTTIAKMFLDRGTNNWYDAPFVAANSALLPAGTVLAPVINPTVPVVRSDPSATNFFMQQFTRQFAPADFLVKVAESKLENFEITESWPFLSTGSRTGSVNTASLVAGWQNPREGVIPSGGVITATPLSEARSQMEDHPETQLFIPEIQNGAGEWVAPTSQSISLAIDKGAGAPLAALTAPIPGAYPLAWVNRLYAPASGLGIDDTNALATVIRYAVTVGQDASVELDEGRLSEALVSEALAAADELVRGNCVGSDRKIVAEADGGPLWPAETPMPVGSFTVCVGVSTGSTPTSTTAPAPRSSVTVAGSSQTGGSGSGSVGVRTPSGFSGAGGSSSGGSSSGAVDFGDEPVAEGFGLPSADDSALLGDVAGDPSANGGGGSPTLVAASLPMGLPDTGRGSLDRLSTMLLGGLCLLIGRGVVRRSRVAT